MTRATHVLQWRKQREAKPRGRAKDVYKRQIQDTAKEVQNLKQKGIQVIGIFMGSARSGEVAGKIFGQNLIKIRNISDFSQAVGRVLQEIVFS